MKRTTTMNLPNLSLAGFSHIDTSRQWAPSLGYKAVRMRDGLQRRWADAAWRATRVHVELDADTISAGIVFGSMMIFATVGMIAVMAVANLAHAETVVHDEDLYNLSKPIEPSAGDTIIEPHVTRVYDDGRSTTTVNETPAVVTNRVAAPDVRVILPSGEMIVAANPLNAPWWQDERVKAYRTYYYDHDRDVYVIYEGDAKVQPKWRSYDNRWDADGNPCPHGTRGC